MGIAISPDHVLEHVSCLQKLGLIEAGAPQKGSSRPRKVQWARSSIQAVLSAAEEYAYGIKRQSRKGEAFEIPVEPIISILTYEQFRKSGKRIKHIPSIIKKTII
ncbi:MAG: hypothetical protein H8D34_00170 [Chloroflexi bacterium]|nr:hypothetical protein [Chloroflexota bacterium]